LLQIGEPPLRHWQVSVKGAGSLSHHNVIPHIPQPPHRDSIHILSHHLLLCAHRNPPADLILLESMDLNPASSRKRANCLSVPPNDSLCQCRCHDDHSRDSPSQKRQKSDRRLRAPLPHSEAPLGSVSDSSHNVLRDPFETHSRTNPDINPFGNAFSVFPPLPSSGLQTYLTFNGQHFPQQNVRTANNTAETSVSYTASDDTFSPRSLNKQVGLDINDCTTQSPNVASELRFDGSDDFSLEHGSEWWDASSASLLTFSGPGRRSFELILRFLTILSWL
jgi:hypothetical protein